MSHDVLPHSDDPMIIFRVRKSEWFIIGPMIFVGLGALLLVIMLLLVTPAQSIPPLFQVGIYVIIMFGFVVAGLIVYLDWVNTEYILTSSTIEKITGFVTKNKTYMSLHDLSRVESRIGIMGRMFNFGTVVVESETSESPLFLPGTADPNKIVDLIRSARTNVAGSDK